MIDPTVTTNFLALESLLIAHLTAQLADLSPKPKVLSAVDLAGVAEEQQFTPAVHVVYKGYRIAESRIDGKAARMVQTWLAVVATRNVRQARTGEAARSDAGVIARRVLAALMGHRPAGAAGPLRLVDGPEAGFSAGYQYLPLAFTVELALSNA